MRIKKAIIVGLMLPLVSEICAMPSGAVSYVNTPTSRPSTTARMPTLLTGSITSTAYSTATNAGLAATCANPLPERLTSNRCIDRYDSCLHQENVCGENFELCYNLKQFNKSRIMCQDYLAQCPAEAIKAIFGNSVTTSDDFSAANRAMCDGESVLIKRSFSPALGDIAVAGDSRIDIAIKEGRNWAAANSVKTCNKAADVCIQNACQGSPQKCISLTGFSDIDTAEMVNIATSGETTLRLNAKMLETWIFNMGWDDSNVKNYLKEQCRETIGANEWCFMVTNGKPAKESDLVDNFNIQEVFQDIMYNGVGARWKMSQSKIKEWAAATTKNSVAQCQTALTDCAINACGEGSRARCYGLAKDGNSVSIKNKAGSDIEGQCKNLIENNQYCKDVFRNNETGLDGDVWTQVWTNDVMGTIVGLDSDLQKMFNEEAVAEMRRSCQTQAEKCVQDECGSDFSRCFITSSDAKKSSQVAFASGKVTSSLFAGGFDEALARDLCILKVKQVTDCNDYFDVQYAKQSSGKSADAWATSSTARNAWLGAANSTTEDNVCRVTETYLDKYDVSGNAIDPTVKLASKVKVCAAQERSIFDGLLGDINKRANSVLEREANDIKNTCENSNVKGSTAKDYIWAAFDGLGASDEYSGFSEVSETSNPFDGFCAVRVTIRSNNSKVVSALGGNKTMYYPKGTTMPCLGLTTDELEKVERAVASDVKFCGSNETSATHGCVERMTKLQKTLSIGGATLGGLVVGGLGGVMAGNAIQNQTTSSGNGMGEANRVMLKNCNSCLAAQGAGFSSKNACGSASAGDNDDGKSNAIAKNLCQAKANELSAKTKKQTNSSLMDFTSTGGITGASVGAGLLGLTGGLLAGNAIDQNEKDKLAEARQQAIDDFNAKTDINCYIGGRKVAAYGSDMVIK